MPTLNIEKQILASLKGRQHLRQTSIEADIKRALGEPYNIQKELSALVKQGKVAHLRYAGFEAFTTNPKNHVFKEINK
jgi:hypothetical protein